ncbi:MAG: protoporphyrinogen oxidase, partial [Candidatus Kapaibacterium sp.]
YGADPFITGIYAGDPEKLSMRHAFGSMWRAEQEHGSLLKGLIKGRKGNAKQRIKPRVISFPEGLSELTTALRASLGDRLQLHSGAIALERTGTGYRVTSSVGTVESPAIILALPAYHIAPMIAPLSSELSTRLQDVLYPPVAVVFLGYAENQFAQVPEGFGGLIPSKEKRNILGVIFSSSNFPNRAPEGHLLLTILMGGAKKQEIANWDETQILETAISEIRNLLKPTGEPAFQRMKVWRHAIPQYNVGYSAILDAIKRAEKENPGLHFIGNYRGGISMGACIKNATELASRLV